MKFGKSKYFARIQDDPASLTVLLDYKTGYGEPSSRSGSICAKTTT
jgi:hypothetical protein